MGSQVVIRRMRLRTGTRENGQAGRQKVRGAKKRRVLVTLHSRLLYQWRKKDAPYVRQLKGVQDGLPSHP